MNQDYDKIEEDLKKQAQPKKELKKSGRSIFKLQEIIAKRGIDASRGNSTGIIKNKTDKEDQPKKEENQV